MEYSELLNTRGAKTETQLDFFRLIANDIVNISAYVQTSNNRVFNCTTN